MQTDVAETIFDIVKVLPRNKQERVLDFVSDLRNDQSSSLTELISEVKRRGEEIPDDVWNKIPKDGSVNHDYYLYGSKKRK